jgi:hypothetical protein
MPIHICHQSSNFKYFTNLNIFAYSHMSIPSWMCVCARVCVSLDVATMQVWSLHSRLVACLNEHTGTMLPCLWAGASCSYAVSCLSQHLPCSRMPHLLHVLAAPHNPPPWITCMNSCFDFSRIKILRPRKKCTQAGIFGEEIANSTLFCTSMQHHVWCV